jgi:AraC-like DNA-binding protein
MVAKEDSIRFGAGATGIERLEARFRGKGPAFALHRHDTYAIGITLAGVQSFNFRGQRWHCLPGQCHVLHPDELHDGGAGTEEGFAYRIVYVDPALVQEAIGGGSLPFVPDPVVDAHRLPERVASEIWDLEDELDDLTRTGLVVALANLLVGASPGRPRRPAAPLALDRLRRVRDLIAAAPAECHSMAELEALSGLDRWTLARQFRAAFGTSPSRFRTLRRLDRLRSMVRDGMGLAEASAAAGFADQSHMSRQFKRAYGLTPARWAAALA